MKQIAHSIMPPHYVVSSSRGMNLNLRRGENAVASILDDGTWVSRSSMSSRFGRSVAPSVDLRGARRPPLRDARRPPETRDARDETARASATTCGSGSRIVLRGLRS